MNPITGISMTMKYATAAQSGLPHDRFRSAHAAVAKRVIAANGMYDVQIAASTAAFG